MLRNRGHLLFAQGSSGRDWKNIFQSRSTFPSHGLSFPPCSSSTHHCMPLYKMSLKALSIGQHMVHALPNTSNVLIPHTSFQTNPMMTTQVARRFISIRGGQRSSGSTNAAAAAANDAISKVHSIMSGGSSSNNSSELPPHVRDHVVRTYALLAAGIAVASFGSSLMIFTPLAKTIPYYVPMIGAFVPMLWLSFRPPANQNLKLALFFSFCFLEGMAIAPIVWMSASKGVLFTALFLTFAIFAGFTAAALLSPQGSLLAFQGPLFGLMLGFVGISLLNMIWPSRFVHSILLYGGLALFSALIAVDTQAMIERARCGMGDHVQDAMSLFINMINIFVRLAQILRGD